VYAIYFVPILILAAVLYYWSPFALRPTLWWTRPGPMYLTAACLLMLGLVIVFHPYSVSRPDGRLRVDFLDVGQGDSALVTFPDGRTLLVDGGGRFRYETGNGIGMDESEPFEPDVRGIGEAVVSEFLWNQGLSRIDYILATHADADHIQGLTDVAKNFKIGKALVARRPMEDPDFAAFDEVLNRRGISEEIVSRGDSLQFGDVTIEVLNPAASDTTGTLENNRSVVLRIVMGSRAFLLTGDIEAPAESSMVTGGGMLAADLVRVPHHGSRTSSTQEFIEATHAKYAVISVGRSSPFGHPHADVLSRWRGSGANVMTTGKRGMISVSTDGKDLQVDTFVP